MNVILSKLVKDEIYVFLTKFDVVFLPLGIKLNDVSKPEWVVVFMVFTFYMSLFSKGLFCCKKIDSFSVIIKLFIVGWILEFTKPLEIF